jgi:hypothetical protein
MRRLDGARCRLNASMLSGPGTMLRCIKLSSIPRFLDSLIPSGPDRWGSVPQHLIKENTCMGRSTYWQIDTPHHNRTSRAQTGSISKLYLHFIYTLSTLYLHFIYTLSTGEEGHERGSSVIRSSVCRTAVTRPRDHGPRIGAADTGFGIFRSAPVC